MAKSHFAFLNKKLRLLCFLLFVNFSANAQTLIDSFTMTFSSYFSRSTPATNSGHQYALKVSGVFTIWSCPTPPLDAAFIHNTCPGPIGPNIRWSWNGILPLDTTTYFRPTPDIFNSNHEYWFNFAGTGGPQTFAFQDSNNYSDNSGDLLFELYDMCVDSIQMNPVNSIIVSTDTAYFALTHSSSSASFQWQENTGFGYVNVANSGIYSGVNSDTLKLFPVMLSMNGYLYRCVTTVNNCVDTSKAATLLVSPNGISTLEANALIMYPNPVKDILQINHNGDVAIFDVAGRLAINVKGVNIVNLTSLQAGTYYAIVTLKDGMRFCYTLVKL